MEIDNLKKAWQETIDSREKNTEINYLVLKKLTLETTSSSINKILNFQKIGTFLALLYAIISFALGFIFLTTYYCVPLFISGILMVYCFWGHYKNNKMIENIDYYKTPVKDYLKTVLQYENKIYEAKKSDYIITFFWVTAISPLYIKYVKNIDVFEDSYSLLIFLGVLIVISLFIAIGTNSIYKNYGKKFNVVKNQLEEILEFEKE
jgi:4-hydroxybenzoate polyprenyltransferase